MSVPVPPRVSPPRVSQPTVNVRPQPGVLSNMFSAIGRFFTAPLRFSLAGRAGCALFLFLALLVAVVWFLLFRDPNVVIWRSYMSATRILLVVALVIITPLVVYFCLRLWLVGDKSQFPDIDYAMIGIGAYKPDYMMQEIHTSPAEALEAFRKLGAETLIPMHYGTYDLSDEPASEPYQEIQRHFSDAGMPERLRLPKVGEGVGL